MRDDLADKAAERLSELNDELAVGRVHAFRFDWDDDFDRNVAWLMFVLPEPDGETWSLEEIDQYCAKAFDKLQDLVAYTYCDFLIAEEVTETLVSERNLGWREVGPPAHAA